MKVDSKIWLLLVGITTQFTDLNLKVIYNNNKLMTQLYDDIKCFITKLSLWKSQLSNKNLVHFPKCSELKNTANTESVPTEYDSHLELLSKEFQERLR